MWSSEKLEPFEIVSKVNTPSAAVSSCTAKWKESSPLDWLLHMIPIRFPPKAMMLLMSSLTTAAPEPPATVVRAVGVFQLKSSQVAAHTV